MKLSNYREAYYAHTGSASSVGRQVAFAGIALIWVFNAGNAGEIALPTDLLWPALLLILGLALDLTQYVFASAIWGVFHRLKEKQLGADPDPPVSAPPWLNWPTLFCFWGKLVTIIVGYLFLLRYVGHAIVLG